MLLLLNEFAELEDGVEDTAYVQFSTCMCDTSLCNTPDTVIDAMSNASKHTLTILFPVVLLILPSIIM